LGDGTHLNLTGRIAEGKYVAQSIAGNSFGYPNIWDFQSPTPYRPVLGQNPSNGMDFSADVQREVGTYVVLPSLGTLASAKYVFSFASALLSVAPAWLQLTANDKTMTAGDTLPVFDGSMSGALPADGVSARYLTSATSTSAVGRYSIVPMLVDPKNRLPNYSVSLNSGTLTVVPRPAITALSPPFVSAGTGGFAIAVSGTDLAANSVVYWGGTALATQFVSSTSLSAQVPVPQIASTGIASITVRTSQNSVISSNAVQFEIDSKDAAPYAPTFAASTASVQAGAVATYPVSFPSTATNISAACLNLPVGGTCTYSSGMKAVTVSTSALSPVGTYQIVVVFTETVPGAASALLLFPVLFVPLGGKRKRKYVRMAALVTLLIAGLAAAMAFGGCSAGSNPAPPFQPQTHQITSSGTVLLNVR